MHREIQRNKAVTMEFYDVKRFVEWWIGDAEFRRKFKANHWNTIREYNVEVDPEAVAILCSESNGSSEPLPENAHPAVRAYNSLLRATEKNIEETRRRGKTSNPSFATWRSRQMARLAGQDHSQDSSRNPHALFSIELTKGCSIRCDYCAFDAGPLRAVARFTRENESLFRGILRVFVDFFGEGADIGYLYCATEPLDNPDYEKYLSAFREELGTTPHTTTAAWFRDISRTRRFLNQVEHQGVSQQRFSINSLEELALCMKTFSARELRDVSLAIHHSGSLSQLASTGRGGRVHGSIDGTIACVTGFLLNILEKSVKLISPCVEPKRWPLGYRVFSESHFEEAVDLLDFMRQCQKEIMEKTISHDYVPRLRDDLRITWDEYGQLVLTSRYRRFTVPEGISTELVKAIDGNRTVAQIVNELRRIYPLSAIHCAIETWWEEGFFEDLEKSPLNSNRQQL
jgi:radical SAM family RiPP maturation amino acid epimerase